MHRRCLYFITLLSINYIAHSQEKSIEVEIKTNSGETLNGNLLDITEQRIQIYSKNKSSNFKLSEIKSYVIDSIKLVRFKDEWYKSELESERLNVFTKAFEFKGKRGKSNFINWLFPDNDDFYYSRRESSSPFKRQNRFMRETGKTIGSISTSSVQIYLQKDSSNRLFPLASDDALKVCYLFSGCPALQKKIYAGGYSLIDIPQIVEEYNNCENEG